MPRAHITARSTDLHEGFEQIRRELDVRQDFPPAVLDAARVASDHCAGERADRRDLPLVSIDPAGSRDLDQAFHLASRAGGYRFSYAIADVAAWIPAGGPLDSEAWERGSTVYCPDTRIPLHPPLLSEGAASLLPDGDRPAVLWTIDLDDRAAVTDIGVERALVRNREALDYAAAQGHLDAGGTHQQLRLLEEVGSLRLEREIERGGVSLTLPDQIIAREGDRYRLEYGATLDTERWNAQLSLCCGMAAAELMIQGGVGVLRTLPDPEATVLDSLRLTSEQLGVPWPEGRSYPEWVRSLDPATGEGAALMVAAARTLRGAGYTAFDGAAPNSPNHHALAAPYAHVTAPLRRLVDRFGAECALALCSGVRPPRWTLDALESLPGIMEQTASRVSAVERACVDLVEAAILQHRVGEALDGVVTALRNGTTAVVQLTDPAVIATAPIVSRLEAGDRVVARVVEADPRTRTVSFEIAPLPR